jgi:hypothetical protein
MIAMAGHFKYEAGEFTDQDVTPLARYSLWFSFGENPQTKVLGY